MWIVKDVKLKKNEKII